MRIEIVFSFDNELRLPVQYNHMVQALLYNTISPGLAEFLHNQGFEHEGRAFKLFTFSRLMGRFRMQPEGEISFGSPVQLIVASPIERFINELGEGLLRAPGLHLGKNALTVDKITVLPEFGLAYPAEVKIKMLSPVVAYHTIPTSNGARTLYYSPWDPEFAQLLQKNLLRKYETVYGELPAQSVFEFTTVGSYNRRYQKIVSYKDTIIKGWMGIYRLYTDTHMLQLAQAAGLGSKNSQGFGCFEICT